MNEDAKFLKRIRVKNLNENTDIAELAEKIVENCNLISISKLPQIEHLLRYLLKRKASNRREAAAKPTVISEKLSDPGAFDSTETDELAHLTDLDEYLELLYEDIPDKLRASALVLQLARNPDNLEELFQNETLVGAIARVLREDWKKSTDLATNITYIFFCFSSFSNFHSVILHFKIGALTMSIIEHELKKYDLWLEELEVKKRALSSVLTKSDSTEVEETKKSYETSLSKFDTLMRKQEQLFRVSFYLLLNISEDLTVELKMHNKGVVSMICQCLDRENFELLILLVSFLKKLSIFRENKEDMLKNGIIERLKRILCRPEGDLLNITLRLLFNLSFDTATRLEMVEQGLIKQLVKFLDNENHRPVALYVLYHLSTEDNSKSEFAKTDCLQVLMRLILETPDKQTDLVPMALAINLACDSKCAQLLGEGKGIRLMMKRSLKMRDPLLMKLLRNLSDHGDDLKMKFVDHLPLMVQVVIAGGTRSTSSKSNRSRMSSAVTNGSDKHMSYTNYLNRMAKIPTTPTESFSLDKFDPTDPFHLPHRDRSREVDDRTESPSSDGDFVLECLGCLANLKLKDLDFSRILSELRLLDWIEEKMDEIVAFGKSSSVSTLQPCFPLSTEDDVTLEVVRLLGTICTDREAAKLVIDAKLIGTLIKLLNAKQEDDEIVCQIVHVFYQLVHHAETIEKTVESSQAPAYLIDLMHDKNTEIRRLCDLSLDIISEYDSNWGTRIQAERFRWHNSQWLDMIDSATNPTVIESDPTTDAVMAAAMVAGHARPQYRRGLADVLDEGGDGEDDEGVDGGTGANLFDSDDDDIQDRRGPLGMGYGIDDAAAFLRSLPTSQAAARIGPVDAEHALGLSIEDMNYLSQLEMMYPDMYGDLKFLGNGTSSPAFNRSSPVLSDSDSLGVTLQKI